MFEGFLERLQTEPPGTPVGEDSRFARQQVAVAVLLLEAAQVGHNLTPEERAHVARMVREHMGLRPEDADALIAAADTALANALEDWVFTKAIRDGFGRAERIETMEMMWEVIYSDDRADPFEEDLVRRVSREMRLEAEVVEAARISALARGRAGRGTGAGRK